jgi:hypothetical protein
MPLIKYNNQSLSSITTLPASIPTGKLKIISSQTASNSASISFTTGLNSTYKVYKFVFVNIRPVTDNVNFTFNMSTDSGSNYNVTKTSTLFKANANEAGNDNAFFYDTGIDLAQSTGFQVLTGNGIGNASDKNLCGYLDLFNPSSTTYVKHFISRNNSLISSDYTVDSYVAGYGNTTSAINAIRFQMSSGNISAGTIYLYAIDNS